jgi:hypothetical protein
MHNFKHTVVLNVHLCMVKHSVLVYITMGLKFILFVSFYEQITFSRINCSIKTKFHFLKINLCFKTDSSVITRLQNELEGKANYCM